MLFRSADGLWVCDAEWPGVRVVERPLAEGEQGVTVLVDPGARCVISGDVVPWKVCAPSVETLRRAELSERLTISLGQRRAKTSPDALGWTLTDDNERVLSVKLHELCAHDPAKRLSKACGHQWCSFCDGWVHPGTGVVLKGAGGVLKCNRLLHDLGRYKYLFRENMAGSARLTQAMQVALRGIGRVAAARDLEYTLQMTF